MIDFGPEYLVGVAEIDQEHRELVERANRLISAVGRDAQKKEIRELFEYLERYVHQHFAAEERYMKLYYYGEVQHHRQEHQAFIRDFRELKQDLDVIESNQAFVGELIKIVSNWTNLHVKKTDRALGEFLQGIFPVVGRFRKSTS